MKASVVLTSVNFGGLDLLVHSFAQQTMPVSDYEVVFVDEFWEQRKGLLPSPPFVHIPPRVRKDVHDNASAINTAIAAASGELIIFIVDYCWLYPEFLADHWRIYEESGRAWSMSGYFDRYEYPPICGIDNHTRYSAFEREFDANFAKDFFATHEPTYRERKGGAGIQHADGKIEMPGDKIYLINDSIPMRVLRLMNGVDERYDGIYAVFDIDTGMRANLCGHKFLLNPNSVVARFGMPGVKPIPGVTKKKTGTPDEARQFLSERIDKINKGEELVAVPGEYGAFR